MISDRLKQITIYITDNGNLSLLGNLGRFHRDGGPQIENKKMNRSFLGSHGSLLIYGILKQAGEGQNQI